MDCRAKYGCLDDDGKISPYVITLQEGAVAHGGGVQSTAPLGCTPFTTTYGSRGRRIFPLRPVIAAPGFCAKLSTMSMSSMHRAAIPVLALLGLTGCYTSSSMDSGPPGENPECPLWGTSVFVDYVQAISEPSEGFVTVTLLDGHQFRLDVQTARGEFWAGIIGSYRDSHEPLYFEVDGPGTMTIIHLLLPLESPVRAVRTAAEGTEVELDYSAAIHFLHLSHTCYEQMLAALETSLSRGSAVLVSTDYNDGNRILDVREPLEP